MDEQRQDDQLEPIYNCTGPIQNVALKTYRERWTIETGGERGSGRSVLALQHDDYDDEGYKTTNDIIKILNYIDHLEDLKLLVWNPLFTSYWLNSTTIVLAQERLLH